MDNLTSSIKELSSWQQLTFGAAMVNRMAQNYMLFCAVSEQGDARVFQNILQLVWEYAAGSNNNIDFMRQQDKLESVIANPDKFDGFGVWPALDATSALYALVSACHSPDIEELVSIAKLSRSTIEYYLEVCEVKTNTEEHPLLVADKEYKLTVIDLLHDQGNTKSRKDCVFCVKSLANSFDVSNIGVSFP